MSRIVWVCFVPILLILQVSGLLIDPSVTTPLGKIEGHWLKSTSLRSFAAFEGVPYALPPTGERRFEEAQPVEKWSGTLKAKLPRICLQYLDLTLIPGKDFVVGDEDCLYVNVYTPQVKSSTPLKVIVFIHGGAFMYGAGALFGPLYIMDRDVVYVTINYRLGPLGFLSTEDSLVPGNNGLKDQLLALKWVKENIQYFSGDPNSITLTGQSAGGASVHLHTLSPLSKGIFHRAIAVSGTALNPWVIMENALQKTKQLALFVNCKFNLVKDMVKCMKQKKGREVVGAVKHFQPFLYNPFSPFGVVVDEWSNNPFVPEHPYKLLQKKQVPQDVPIIFSNVEAEGLYPGAEFIAKDKYINEIDQNWDEVVPHILDFNNTVSPDRRGEVTKEIRAFYFGDAKVSKSTFLQLVKMITDRLYVVEIERAAKLHAAAIKAPVHYYYFSYRGHYSVSEILSYSLTNYGVCHTDDVLFVVSSPLNYRLTKADREMSDLLLNMWESYGAGSNPKLGSLTWTPVVKNESAPISYAHIKTPDNIQMETSSDLANRPFWDGLHFQENQNL